jgi:hypothetical protein
VRPTGHVDAGAVAAGMGTRTGRCASVHEALRYVLHPDLAAYILQSIFPAWVTKAASPLQVLPDESRGSRPRSRVPRSRSNESTVHGHERLVQRSVQQSVIGRTAAGHPALARRGVRTPAMALRAPVAVALEPDAPFQPEADADVAARLAPIAGSRSCTAGEVRCNSPGCANGATTRRRSWRPTFSLLARGARRRWRIGPECPQGDAALSGHQLRGARGEWVLPVEATPRGARSTARGACRTLRRRSGDQHARDSALRRPPRAARCGRREPRGPRPWR